MQASHRHMIPWTIAEGDGTPTLEVQVARGFGQYHVVLEFY